MLMWLTLACQGNASYSRELAICQTKQSLSKARSKQSCPAANLSNTHTGFYITTMGHAPVRSPRSYLKTNRAYSYLERVHSLHPPSCSWEVLAAGACHIQTDMIYWVRQRMEGREHIWIKGPEVEPSWQEIYTDQRESTGLPRTRFWS